MKHHTVIVLEILPGGGKPYSETYLFDNVVMDDITADDYISWGGERNDIIKDAVNKSKYQQLENYEIIKCSNLSDCDLGARWGIENSNRLEKKKKKNFTQDTKELSNHGWINPQGRFFKVNGFHMDWADGWIYRNNKEDRYNEWLDKSHEWDRKIDGYSYHNASTYLEVLGWIRLQGSRISDMTPYIKDAHFEKFSDAQYITLSNICDKYGANFKTVIECSNWYDYNGKRRGDKMKAIYKIKY